MMIMIVRVIVTVVTNDEMNGSDWELFRNTIDIDKNDESIL